MFFQLRLGIGLAAAVLGSQAASAALVHQWNFNEASGTNLLDSVGTAHASVVITAGGGGYSLDGKRVRLDGGTRSNADYVIFPENTFDGLNNITLEIWAIPHSFPNYGRIFEIGPGEGNDTVGKLVRAAFSNGANGDMPFFG